MRVILASKSPRRRELLNQLNVNYEIMESTCEEQIMQNISNEDLVKKLAVQKARDVYLKTDGDRCVIGADTIVVVDGKKIGKPANKQVAKKMLQKLSGKFHFVFTGLAVIVSKDGKEKVYSEFDATKVYFDSLSDGQIDAYINTNEPMDKAGAYGIQGIGGKFVTKIEGSYSTVVGLPLNKLYNILLLENIIIE